MGWQPIETAPKDGQTVTMLVEGTFGGEINAKWMGSWWGFDRPTLGTPTNWKPIPTEAQSGGI